jgi:hypothetical protein
MCCLNLLVQLLLALPLLVVCFSGSVAVVGAADAVGAGCAVSVAVVGAFPS